MLKKSLFVFLFVAGCGNYQPKEVAKVAGPSSLLKGDEGEISAVKQSHIECVAQKYDGVQWTELGRFRSKPEPVPNNGELSQNAEFTNGNISFSADGNYEEGLIYFGSIYDQEHRSGTQIQLAQHRSLDLYLFQGSYQFNLHCDMVHD